MKNERQALYQQAGIDTPAIRFLTTFQLEQLQNIKTQKSKRLYIMKCLLHQVRFYRYKTISNC